MDKHIKSGEQKLGVLDLRAKKYELTKAFLISIPLVLFYWAFISVALILFPNA